MSTGNLPQAPVMPLPGKVALGLLVAVVLGGLVRMLLEPAPVDPTLPIWFGPVVGGVTFLLLALLVYAIATGRRWALILSAALFVIGLPASFPFLQEQSPRALVVSGGQALASVVAYVLLFTKRSRQWFRAAREFRRSKSGQPNKAIEPTR